MVSANPIQEFPALEVLVWRGERLIATEYAESERHAAEIIARWSEEDGITARLRQDDDPEGVDLPPPVEDEYPG